MATVKKLVYRVWRILEGGDVPDDSRFRYREIRDHVRGAIKEALKQNYFEQANAGESRYGDDALSQVFDAEIQLDPATGVYYVENPAETISVPASTRTTDIMDSNPYSIWATEYIPVRMEEAFVAGLQDSIPCCILYTRIGNRFEFFNDVVEAGTKVKIVKKYAVTENDEEELQLPGEYETWVVDRAVRILNPEIRPADRANDGVPLNN